MRRDESHILGATSIRHYLNEDLLQTGGHIAYGIRPSERRKGYATQQLTLALQKCGEMGIARVLITCDDDNVGSAKVIVHNGGVLENKVSEDTGQLVRRYWINLPPLTCA